MAAVVTASVLASCSGVASTTDSFGYDDVALFGGLDTRAVVLEQEELIATCMATEGFDYVPFVPENIESYPDPGTLASLPDAGYVADHGFGLADRVRAQWVASDSDPNKAIVEALSQAERNAYFDALMGTSNTGEARGGCSDDSISAEYLDAVRRVSELRHEAVLRMEADPEYTDAMDLWSECMAKDGYQFSDRRRAVLDYFGPRVDEVVLSRDHDALDRLADEEAEVAKADLACVEPHAATLAEIAARYEGPLVDQTEEYLSYLKELAATYGTR